jgi:PHD/YefM family antitoxin component YafN of YafNO toxin-antitoxin module
MLSYERNLLVQEGRARPAAMARACVSGQGGSAYVITRRGRPAAVLMPVEEADDLVVANADEYVR